MSFIDEFNQELYDILKKRDTVVKSASLELHRAVIKATPVDSGHLKGSWHWSQVAPGHYQTATNVEYAPVIDGGRREVEGKTVGSYQLPQGYKPVIERARDKLQEKLKAIK